MKNEKWKVSAHYLFFSIFDLSTNAVFYLDMEANSKNTNGLQIFYFRFEIEKQMMQRFAFYARIENNELIVPTQKH